MSGPAVPAPVRVGVLYFALAAVAIVTTRFDGGVAMIWFASAYLIAELSVVRRSRWPALVCAAAIASVLATGLLGFGWKAAVPMAFANLVEAVVAAFLLRRDTRQTPLESLRWLGQFIVAVAIIAPLVSGAFATLVATLLGKSPTATMIHWVTGHGLGNLTFAPLLMLFAQGECKHCWQRMRGRRGEAASLMALSIAVTAACFAQRIAPLLFLPVLPIVLLAFRLGRLASALAILALALIGCGATLAGLGPLSLMTAGAGTKAQFFQFYLAMTVLTVWPIVADLRTRARLHDVLHASEERYRLIADHSSDILLKLDRRGRVIYVSKSVRVLGDFHPEALKGRAGLDFIPQADHARVQALFRQALAEPDTAHSFEFEATIADGSRHWFEAHTRAVVVGDGDAIGTMSIIRDIAQRKANERSLSEAALTDVLTGLPNRRAFREMAETGNYGSSERPDCLAVIDIDHFKHVNDQYGHAAGDGVLRAFAATAGSAVRDGDMVLRIGGEEFAVLFRNTALAQATEICERLRCNVAETVMTIDGARIRITISGGVAQIGPGGLTAALKVADGALYRAKRAGRDRLSIAA